MKAKHSRLFIFFIFLSVQFTTTVGQEYKSAKDSIRIVNHDPMKSWQYSAIVPGLGQIYNRKYWKVPIVYAGGVACYYFYREFSKGYHAFHDAYVGIANYGEMQPEAANQLFEYYDGRYTLETIYAQSDAFILNRMQSYQKDRERMVVFMFGMYFLNIIDALVDGYMFHYDVSDELTLRWQPDIFVNLPDHSTSPALSLVLNF